MPSDPIEREAAIAALEEQQRTFLSPEYATGQPLSSMMERFACDRCIEALRTLPAAGGDERLREALTPSGDTKAAYMGEFAFNIPDSHFDEESEEFVECSRKVYVPWDTIKEIMAAIRALADPRHD